MYHVVAALLLLNFMGLIFYETERISDTQQRRLQEPIVQRATSTVGMPTVENFHERWMLRKVLEARDHPVQTQVYLVNPAGQLVKLCDAVGYGLPAASQLTNPFQPITSGGSIALAEPNALFNSPSTEGTWVECIDHTRNVPHMVFVQPAIVVSAVPLTGVAGPDR
jgi:hypothetical protein